MSYSISIQSIYLLINPHTFTLLFIKRFNSIILVLVLVLEAVVVVALLVVFVHYFKLFFLYLLLYGCTDIDTVPSSILVFDIGSYLSLVAAIIPPPPLHRSSGLPEQGATLKWIS